jgi:site-specific DNA recombinase
VSNQYLDCYIRVSSQEQTGNWSIDTQRELGEKVAKEKDCKYREWNEGGKSSTIGYRPKLEELKEDIEKGRVKNLWVLDRSRLFRDETDSSLFRREYLTKYKVSLFEGERGNECSFDSLEEKLSYDIVSKIQQYENEKRTYKSISGKRYLLRQNVPDRHYGGLVQFGYKSEDGLLTVDKEQSEWVVWMFNAVLKGTGTMEIKHELDRNGVQPPRETTKLWNHQTILNILNNKSYIGEKEFKDKHSGETFTYSITPLVSRDTFLRVREEIKKRQTSSENKKKHFSLFGQLLKCECGEMVGSEVKKGIRTDGTPYNTRSYYCQSISRKWKLGKKSDCRNGRSMNMDRTDEFLMERISEIVSDSVLLKEKFKDEVLDTKKEQDKNITRTVKKLDAKCRKLVKRQEQTCENIVLMETDLIQGRKEKKIVKGILERLREELQDLRDEVSKTELEIQNLGEEKRWLDWVKKYGQDLKVKLKDKNKRKEWVEGLVDKIIVRVVDGTDKNGKSLQVGHQMDIFFRMKIVKDKLIYLDRKNKSLGYEIKEGTEKTTSDVVNLRKGRGKKKVTNQVNSNGVKNNHSYDPLHHRGMMGLGGYAFPCLLTFFLRF